MSLHLQDLTSWRSNSRLEARQKQLNGRLSLLEVNPTGIVYLWVGLTEEHLDSMIGSQRTTDIIFQLTIETMIHGTLIVQLEME